MCINFLQGSSSLYFNEKNCEVRKEFHSNRFRKCMIIKRKKLSNYEKRYSNCTKFGTAAKGEKNRGKESNF